MAPRIWGRCSPNLRRGAPNSGRCWWRLSEIRREAQRPTREGFGAFLLDSLWRRWPGCAPVLLLKPPAAPQDRLASLSSSAHLGRSLWPFRCFWCPKQRCTVMGCTRGPPPASFWSLAGAGLTKSRPKASPPAFSRESFASSAFVPPLLSSPLPAPFLASQGGAESLEVGDEGSDSTHRPCRALTPFSFPFFFPLSPQPRT